MYKKLTIFGMISSLLYVIYVILGGFLWKNYDHIMQPISDLTAKGAPNRDIINILMTISGICFLIFAISGYMYIKKSKLKWGKNSFYLLICMQILMFILSFFPKDLTWFQTSFSGIVHIIITCILMLFTIIIPILFGIDFKKNNKFQFFAIYSIINSLIIFISAVIFVLIYLKYLKYFGLIQRINIGAFQIWISILSFRLFTNKEENINI